MLNDFERATRYETLLALCHLPKRDTRDHPRRSWHQFDLLSRLERGDRVKGTTFDKTLQQTKDQLLEGFRVLRRNRPLATEQHTAVKAFVEAVTDAPDSAVLLETIAAATAWFRTLG